MNKKIFFYLSYGVLIGLLAAGIIWLTTRSPHGEVVTLLPTSTPRGVTVYVTGAVDAPGLYTLPEGSRISDAIQAAGGFTQGAEKDLINLATILQDGEQVNVPGLPETSRVSGGRVNINTATAEELDGLPGIGSTTAQNIVDYRTQHGPFQFIQDIQNVPGVGPSTYEQIKDYIMVGP